MKILLKDIVVSRPIKSVLNNNNEIIGIASILIEDNRISKIYEKGIYPNNYDKVIDGKNKLHAFMDLTDIHVHFRTPGFEYKEDISTGSKAAAAGGFTNVVCMANTKPVIDNKEALDILNKEINDKSVINIYPVGAVTKDLKGKAIADLNDLAKSNIVTFSDDGFGINDEEILKIAYENCVKYNLPIMLHCQSDKFDAYDRNSEIESIKLSIKVLKQVKDAKVHIQHVSCKEGMNLILEAKKEGLNITFETCPHYLTLTSKDREIYKGNAIMNPPLKEEYDKEYSIKLLKEDLIDIVSTDHAPHSKEEKSGDKIMNGIIGLESSIPIVSKVINDKNRMINILLNQMSKNACELVNIPYNSTIANITLIDLDDDYKLDINEFKSKARNCPFHDFDVNSRVITTICNGNIVYQYNKKEVL